MNKPDHLKINFLNFTTCLSKRGVVPHFEKGVGGFKIYKLFTILNPSLASLFQSEGPIPFDGN